MIRSPYPWFGGKASIADVVWRYFGDVKNYVEPFFGSGAILLSRPVPFHGTETVNDLDGMVSNFWRALQASPGDVARHADWPVNECLPAGSLIATPSGQVPIENIQAGIRVYGWDGERIVETQVVATRQSKAEEMVIVDGIHMTANHPVWTKERSYVEAGNLVGDETIAYWPMNECDLCYNGLYEENETMGNLRVGRSSALRTDGRSLPFDKTSGFRYPGDKGSASIRVARIASLQRIYLPNPIAVFNFQTETGNYFVNGLLVHNCDLHARHLWLTNEGRRHVERLKIEPEYFDARIAGWWVWGCCQWIGSGWCEHPEWQKLPHLGDAGMGIHRPSQQLPHLGDAGMGIHRPSQQRPHLGNAGMGIHRPSQKLPHLGDAGRGEIYDYFTVLAKRMRRVRVCCGDWSRVCGPSPTTRRGLTAVFLDPPYSQAERNSNLYAIETDVAMDVRRWCLENGRDNRLRIILCGYEGEGHEELEAHGWICESWKARGGYGSQAEGDTAGRNNAKRERLWISPHRVKNSLFD